MKMDKNSEGRVEIEELIANSDSTKMEGVR